MSLAIFNGSPRGKNSNSNVITQWFLNGYKKDNKIFYLNKINHYDDYLAEASEYEEYMFIMPLYVDGMPGQVKCFIEKMYENKEVFQGKKVTYIIHSGFSEGIQNRALEMYLNRFSHIMDLNNHGVIILPGSEGFRLMPASMTKKKSHRISILGKSYMENVPYNPIVLKKLLKRETTSGLGILMFKAMSKIGLTNMYWNSCLKKNNAFEKRFDAPYSKSPFE